MSSFTGRMLSTTSCCLFLEKFCAQIHLIVLTESRPQTLHHGWLSLPLLYTYYDSLKLYDSPPLHRYSSPQPIKPTQVLQQQRHMPGRTRSPPRKRTRACEHVLVVSTFSTHTTFYLRTRLAPVKITGKGRTYRVASSYNDCVRSANFIWKPGRVVPATSYGGPNSQQGCHAYVTLSS